MYLSATAEPSIQVVERQPFSAVVKRVVRAAPNATNGQSTGLKCRKPWFFGHSALMSLGQVGYTRGCCSRRPSALLRTPLSEVEGAFSPVLPPLPATGET